MEGFVEEKNGVGGLNWVGQGICFALFFSSFDQQT